jgi:uncharacterized SAM-binding protein YcdF (DUF218 family)
MALMVNTFVVILISPLGTVVALGFVSLVICKFGRQSLGWAIGFISLFWLCFFSLPIISHTLRSILEKDFPPIAVENLPKKPAIVVLGGAMRPPSGPDNYPDLRDSADRVWHAARLFHSGRAPLIVLSGGSNIDVREYSEAEAMKLFLIDLGLPKKALLLERSSQNTLQNAQYTADILFPLGVRDILLVTSAQHMGRAVAQFELKGFNVTASATDYESRNRFDWHDFVPDAGALEGSTRAIKEIVGRILY